jgi:hypothetical protein
MVSEDFAVKSLPLPQSCSLHSIQVWLRRFDLFIMQFKCAHMYSGQILRKIAKLERSLSVKTEYLTNANRKLTALTEQEA